MICLPLCCITVDNLSGSIDELVDDGDNTFHLTCLYGRFKCTQVCSLNHIRQLWCDEDCNNFKSNSFGYVCIFHIRDYLNPIVYRIIIQMNRSVMVYITEYFCDVLTYTLPE